MVDQGEPRRPGGDASRRFAFGLVSYAFAVTMLGTTLPTPLYPLYRAQLGFSELLVTVIFAMYAVGVIAALLLLGGMSDQVGRRRMLLAGIALSAASAVTFLVGGGVAVLLLGRVLSGLSAGIFTGTATVTVVELAAPSRRSWATLVATAANMGGLGCGPLLAGLLAQYAPLPLRLCFIVDLVLLVVAAAGVIAAPETVETPGRMRFRPQRLRVPAQVRGVFVPAAMAGFAGFAVLGLFTAVAPAFLGQILGLPDHALTGAVVFVLFASSTAGQLMLDRVPPRWAPPAGCLTLVVGVGLVAGGIGAAAWRGRVELLRGALRGDLDPGHRRGAGRRGLWSADRRYRLRHRGRRPRPARGARSAAQTRRDRRVADLPISGHSLNAISSPTSG